MTKSVLLFALPILIGAILGGLLGATRSCDDGGCPLTANPWRGGLYGAFIGLLFAFSGAAGRSQERPADQPAVGHEQTDDQR